MERDRERQKDRIQPLSVPLTFATAVHPKPALKLEDRVKNGVFPRPRCRLSAAEFQDVWQHYDTDGNGFIEREELDRFIADLFDAQGQIISQPDIAGLKRSLLDCYDSNGDNRIELSEMAEILPVEENFLLKFRMQHRPLTYANFLRIWEFYDGDGSGQMEMSELSNFVTDLMRLSENVRYSDKEMNAILADLMVHFDRNRNGLIEKAELQAILQVPDNFLDLFALYKNLSTGQFNEIFAHYDTDGDGYLAGEEVMELVTDMMRKVDLELSVCELEKLSKRVTKVMDLNADGRLSKTELADLFFTDGQISPFSEPRSSSSVARQGNLQL